MEISNYIECIGQGAFGQVWLAEDTIGRKVAVKFFDDDNQTDEAFNSAKRLGQVSHKNVIVFHSFEQQIHPKTNVFQNAVIMEYCEKAKTLQKMLEVRVSEQEAFNIGTQLIDAIEAIHNNNIAHYDLHDNNILILPSGEIKVIDLAQEQIDTESVDFEKSCDLTKLTDRLSEILRYSTSKSIRVANKLELYKIEENKSIKDLRKIFIQELICAVDNCTNQAVVEVFLYDDYSCYNDGEFLASDFTCPYLCKEHWLENEQKAKSPRHVYIKKVKTELRRLCKKEKGLKVKYIIKDRFPAKYRHVYFTEEPQKKPRGAVKYPYTNQYLAQGYTKYRILNTNMYLSKF